MRENLTPLWQQYWRIKAEYPDVLLLFRVGDFYELFADDAIVAASALEITLTSREAGRGERIPMCGVPFHAVDRYVARLIAGGHRVAICDQLEDGRTAKTLIRRKVTRVITPGTLLDDSMLDPGANNFLAALSRDGEHDVGIAFCDVSTGEFVLTELRGASAAISLANELERVLPAELLVAGATCRAAPGQGVPGPWTVTQVPDIDEPSAREALHQHFGVLSLRGYDCEHRALAIRAAGMVLAYLNRRHVEAVKHVRSLTAYDPGEYMGLDRLARRNLELIDSPGDGGKKRSILAVVDQTRTPMGHRLTRRWLEQPLVDPDRIQSRLDAVELLVEDGLRREDIREQLREVSDLERLASRSATGIAGPRDLAALRTTLEKLPALRTQIEGCSSPLLADILDRLDPMEQVLEVLRAALVSEPPATLREPGLIRPGYSSALDALREQSRSGKDWIASLETLERERTGIRSLKVGYNQVFGYYIEVTRPNVPSVPPEYVRKQTTANGERYVTPDLLEREKQILRADDEIAALESRLFIELREQVGNEAGRLLSVARAIAELDALASFADLAIRQGYCRPIVRSDGPIRIQNGRHPVVEKFSIEPFVPNDVMLNGTDSRLLVITGPNMSGKSTFLRQVAIIVLLAHVGCFVPADAAEMGVVDRIFTRVGAQDDLAAGQSTFMVEMSETASILNHATSRSLVILDEIGRGTSTYDGLSIAWAVAEYLERIGARTLFATHYHHLNDLAERLPGVQNFRAAVKEEGHRVVWLRKIVPGGTDRSYGIQVARLAGLPDSVVDRAREVLRQLEANGKENGALSPAGGLSVRERRQTVQLTLFDGEDHPAVAELRQMDLSAMSPLEALTALFHLQKKVQ